ncbi:MULTISPECIES: IS66 family transposase zinc-finger binding domain-containing protein [Pandoraea]|uniref:IS66 family transposase zinc-finger binding domain-containing protein n=1 Tax=Pandoraea TaxID=93217 RepID=UPI001FE83524|nr:MULTISPECIES: IS66 family transposase zinc-finger binding domain-containing protein [Pandoraea]
MQSVGEDVAEQLARVAAIFKVTRTIRRKPVCPCGDHFSQPPMPQPADNVRHRPSDPDGRHPPPKYADHAPLYQQ